MKTHEQYREYVLGWLKDEAAYQAKKFGDGDFARKDDDRTPEFSYDWRERLERNEFPPTYEAAYWTNQLDQYLRRAFILGVDSPNGRQALAKYTATAVGFLESAVRVYGELPEPGVTSGENLDKLRPL